MEAIVSGPPFTRHSDWFHLGGCLDAILYAPPLSASGSAASANGSVGQIQSPLVCTAFWQPFEHPCLRASPAPPPSSSDIGNLPHTPPLPTPHRFPLTPTCHPTFHAHLFLVPAHRCSQIAVCLIPRELYSCSPARFLKPVIPTTSPITTSRLTAAAGTRQTTWPLQRALSGFDNKCREITILLVPVAALA